MKNEFPSVIQSISNSYCHTYFEGMKYVPIRIGSKDGFESEFVRGHFIPNKRVIELSPEYINPQSRFDSMNNTIKHELVHAWLHDRGYPDQEHGEWFLWKANDADVNVDYLLTDPKRAAIWERIQNDPNWKPSEPNYKVAVVAKPSPPSLPPARLPALPPSPSLVAQLANWFDENLRNLRDVGIGVVVFFIFVIVLSIVFSKNSKVKEIQSKSQIQAKSVMQNSPVVPAYKETRQIKTPPKKVEIAKKIVIKKPLNSRVKNNAQDSLEMRYWYKSPSVNRRVYPQGNPNEIFGEEKEIFGEEVDSPFGKPIFGEPVFGERRRKNVNKR